MKTLIIYDTTGKIFYQASGSLDVLKEPEGIPNLFIEVPIGKRVASIDTSVSPHTPVFEDIAKSEVQLLQEQMNNLNLALAQLMGV